MTFRGDVVRPMAAQTLPEGVESIAFFAREGLELDTSLPDPTDLRALGFEGKAGQTARIRHDGVTYIAVGVGAGDKPDSFRRAAAVATRAAMSHQSLAILVSEQVQAVAEGIVLGSYRFARHKSAPSTRSLASITVVGAQEPAFSDALRIADAVVAARDLVNEPPATMTPSMFADAAQQIAEEAGLHLEVWDAARIEQERLGGLLGVARGSVQPPRFIKLTYEPPNANDHTATVALCGKGITFDSGGLSLKPSDSMVEMKTDMAGAAVVLCAMSALTHFAPDVRVRGYLALTENLPGPNAVKPSDILRARNGKTMEVLNTDAEGRLVLADALSLAVEDQPQYIIDVATLTGAVKIALGNDIAGLYTNSEDLLQRINEAASATDEPVWQLPLFDKYRKLIEGHVADVKNMASPGGGGANTAALFLQEFTGSVPWAHLDIAGTARSDGDDAYLIKGASAFGVRLLIDLLRNFSTSR